MIGAPGVPRALHSGLYSVAPSELLKGRCCARRAAISWKPLLTLFVIPAIYSFISAETVEPKRPRREKPQREPSEALA